MLIKSKWTEFLRRQPRWRLAVAAVLVVLLAGFMLRGRKAAVNGTTFAVRSGPLAIKVIEGGSVEALESQEIRSEIKGYQGTKILKIVDEGYLVTDEDVRSGKVLVELDSSDLKQKVITEEIQFQATLAALTEAQQTYDIQLNQNRTDIKAAEQKARFALMDFQKYVGDKLANSIVEQLDLHEVIDTNALDVAQLERMISAENTNLNNGSAPSAPSLNPDPDRSPANANEPNGSPSPGGTTAAAPSNPAQILAHVRQLSAAFGSTNRPVLIDFSQYADTNKLGDGAAKQALDKLLDDLQVSQAMLSVQSNKLDGTRRLFEKGFVPRTELEADEITFTNNLLKTVTSQIALDLFIKYEFPKAAEEFLSKYDESLRSLERTRKEAISKLAQALAKMRAAEGKYKLESEQLKELRDQFDKCTIRAQKSGLVVYASDGRYYGGEQIREGTAVRERQRIITIPDMKQMSVKVKIHESHIKKINKGLKARITVDAYPDEELNGEISKVAVLPDSQDRWMNPDLKVYLTVIDISQIRDWLKPGMSAKVEIMVKQLTNVVYIPRFRSTRANKSVMSSAWARPTCGSSRWEISTMNSSK
jgi:HlyD family secretion protein